MIKCDFGVDVTGTITMVYLGNTHLIASTKTIKLVDGIGEVELPRSGKWKVKYWLHNGDHILPIDDITLNLDKDTDYNLLDFMGELPNSTEDLTASYLLAKENGYTGSFVDFVDNVYINTENSDITVNLKVGVFWCGDWESTEVYHKNDLVGYQGDVYINISEDETPVNMIPNTEPTMWEIFVDNITANDSFYWETEDW